MLDKTLNKYRTHPDFLGTELTNPNQRGAVDDTPIHIAARKGELDDIEIFVAHGGDINAVGDLGNTPLHYAAMEGNTSVVKRLIELGANLHAKNEFSETPQRVAELGNHDEIVKLLKLER